MRPSGTFCEEGDKTLQWGVLGRGRHYVGGKEDMGFDG